MRGHGIIMQRNVNVPTLIVSRDTRHAPMNTMISLTKFANPGNPLDAITAITMHVPMNGIFAANPLRSGTNRLCV